MSSITPSKVPSIGKLTELLGFEYLSKKKTIFIAAVHSWRKSYKTDSGQPGSDLLDWNQSSVQQELTTMAEKFILDQDNGDRYWSPTRTWNLDGKVEYPDDKEKIIERLKQLFWKQNQNAANTSRYRKTSGFKEEEIASQVPQDSDSMFDPPAETPALQRSIPRDIFGHPDDLDVTSTTSNEDRLPLPHPAPPKHLRDERDIHDDVAQKRRKRSTSSFRRTERHRTPRVYEGMVSEDSMDKVLDDMSTDRETSAEDPEAKHWHRAEQVSTSQTARIPNNIYESSPIRASLGVGRTTAPVAPLVMSENLISEPNEVSHQRYSTTRPTFFGEYGSPHSSASPEMSFSAEASHIETVPSIISPLPMAEQNDDDDSSAIQPSHEHSSVDMRLQSKSVDPTETGYLISPSTVTKSSTSEPALRSFILSTPTRQHDPQTPQATESPSSQNQLLTPSKPTHHVDFWIITREPHFVEERWDDGKIKGKSLSTLIGDVSAITHESHIEKLKLTFVTPSSEETRLSVPKDSEIDWQEAKEMFTQKMKLAVAEARAKRRNDKLKFRILIEPIYGQRILSPIIDVDDVDFE